MDQQFSARWRQGKARNNAFCMHVHSPHALVYISIISYWVVMAIPMRSASPMRSCRGSRRCWGSCYGQQGCYNNQSGHGTVAMQYMYQFKTRLMQYTQCAYSDHIGDPYKQVAERIVLDFARYGTRHRERSQGSVVKHSGRHDHCTVHP